MREGNQNLVSVIQGHKTSKAVILDGPDNMQSLNVERENNIDRIEVIGLQVNDPKRRRMDNPVTKKSKYHDTEEDDLMLDTQHQSVDNQKNNFSAGSVSQARHAL